MKSVAVLLLFCFSASTFAHMTHYRHNHKPRRLRKPIPRRSYTPPKYYYNKFKYRNNRFLRYGTTAGRCVYRRSLPIWGNAVCNLQPRIVSGCSLYRCGTTVVTGTVCGYPLLGYTAPTTVVDFCHF